MECLSVQRERSLAGLYTEHLDFAIVIDVPLTQLGATVEGGMERAVDGNVVADRHHLVTAALKPGPFPRWLHDDDLRPVHCTPPA